MSKQPKYIYIYIIFPATSYSQSTGAASASQGVGRAVETRRVPRRRLEHRLGDRDHLADAEGVHVGVGHGGLVRVYQGAQIPRTPRKRKTVFCSAFWEFWGAVRRTCATAANQERKCLLQYDLGNQGSSPEDLRNGRSREGLYCIWDSQWTTSLPEDYFHAEGHRNQTFFHSWVDHLQSMYNTCPKVDANSWKAKFHRINRQTAFG